MATETIRAYRAVYERARKLKGKGRQGELLAAFQRHLAEAIAADPEEKAAIEVPEEEWIAYTSILDDRSGG
jgi:hypothetical protein